VVRAVPAPAARVSAVFTSFHSWLALPVAGYWMTAAPSALEPLETSSSWPLLREVKVTASEPLTSLIFHSWEVEELSVCCSVAAARAVESPAMPSTLPLLRLTSS
jgi:hypothetical protein